MVCVLEGGHEDTVCVLEGGREDTDKLGFLSNYRHLSIQFSLPASTSTSIAYHFCRYTLSVICRHTSTSIIILYADIQAFSIPFVDIPYVQNTSALKKTPSFVILSPSPAFRYQQIIPSLPANHRSTFFRLQHHTNLHLNQHSICRYTSTLNIKPFVIIISFSTSILFVDILPPLPE